MYTFFSTQVNTGMMCHHLISCYLIFNSNSLNYIMTLHLYTYLCIKKYVHRFIIKKPS